MTTANPVGCEITVLIDEEGNYVVCRQDDDVNDAAATLASDNASVCVRRVDLEILMSPPDIAEGRVTVPDEAGCEITAEVVGG